MSLAKRVLLLGAILFAVPGFCLADGFAITDTTSGVPGTVYTLTLTSLGGSSFSATLQAQTINSNTLFGASWFIDWFVIQFDGGKSPTINSFTSAPGGTVSDPTGNWNYVPTSTQSSVQVQAAGNNSYTIPMDGRVGFYVDGILYPATLTSIQQGAVLNGGTYTWAWSFTLADGTSLNPTPAFQVGYYDGVRGRSGRIAYTRMSQEFNGQAPEPSTLAMIGSGLIVAALLLRSGLKGTANKSNRSITAIESAPSGSPGQTRRS